MGYLVTKGDRIPGKDIQFYCERCRTSEWMKLDVDSIHTDSGLIRRSMIHNDHSLVVEIDKNGSVRKSEAVLIEYTPMTTLVEDVSQGMHYLNSDTDQEIVIDAYTSNAQLKQFFQSIIVEMFKQSTTRRMEDTFKFDVSSFEGRTILHADGLHLSVGPFIPPDFEGKKDPLKGIILDITEAEDNKLDVQATLGNYDWVALIVPKEKKEGYYNGFASLLEETGTPFFIESLNMEGST